MTHAPETGAINRLNFSGTCAIKIWDWILLVLQVDSGYRRLEHCSIPSQKVVCMTEMTIYDLRQKPAQWHH